MRLRALVEANPEVVNARMLVGATPLHLAAANGQVAAAEYLLSKGADVNTVARHAGTPLDLAYESNRPEIIRWLDKPKYSLLAFLGVDTLIPRIASAAPGAPRMIQPQSSAGSAERTVRALYRCVTFQAGMNVDWDQVRALFIPGATIVLRTRRTAMSLFDRDGFVHDFMKFLADAGLEDRGFEEAILAIDVQETGDVARAAVHYSARIPHDGRPAQQGVDLFLLMKKEGIWKIVSVVNEIVRPGVSVPAELRK